MTNKINSSNIDFSQRLHPEVFPVGTPDSLASAIDTAWLEHNDSISYNPHNRVPHLELYTQTADGMLADTINIQPIISASILDDGLMIMHRTGDGQYRDFQLWRASGNPQISQLLAAPGLPGAVTPSPAGYLEIVGLERMLGQATPDKPAVAATPARRSWISRALGRSAQG